MKIFIKISNLYYQKNNVNLHPFIPFLFLSFSHSLISALPLSLFLIPSSFRSFLHPFIPSHIPSSTPSAVNPIIPSLILSSLHRLIPSLPPHSFPHPLIHSCSSSPLMSLSSRFYLRIFTIRLSKDEILTTGSSHLSLHPQTPSVLLPRYFIPSSNIEVYVFATWSLLVK